MSYSQFFWLHIKKSAGNTTRSLLQPYYVEVDRVKKPGNFIQARPEEYNDILNNFRVVLGEYQFRRCLFAKKYLYQDQWDNMFSFAFSREPIDRVLSMFYYLYLNDRGFIRNLGSLGFSVQLGLVLQSEPHLEVQSNLYHNIAGVTHPLRAIARKVLKNRNLIRTLKRSLYTRKLLYNTSYAFDTFLDYAQEARTSNSIYRPLGDHFTTHTAPMWEDITDLDGNILIKAVFRLENLTDGINRAFEECGIEKRLEKSKTKLNKNRNRKLYIPTKEQLRKIENIYHHDFEIYEKADF